jgi:hypothetical protein
MAVSARAVAANIVVIPPAAGAGDLDDIAGPGFKTSRTQGGRPRCRGERGRETEAQKQ